jgi:hypothetical protein
MGSADVDYETPLEYRLMVPRFEGINDELDFMDTKFCEIDEDITEKFEWARKAANCGNITIVIILIQIEINFSTTIK